MKEAIQIISDINYEFYERSGNEEFMPATIEIYGDDYSVLFLGWPVYQSCNDVLDEDTCETLKQFITRGVSNLTHDVSLLKGQPNDQI